MSVRRLAPPEQQPKEFSFTKENVDWAKATIAKYPEGRQFSAVIPLLMRAQEQIGGWLPQKAIEHVADMLGMPYIRALEIATFYTQFQLAPVGRKAHVQVCGTTPCMLRGAGELIKVCQSRIHHDPFHLSEDGNLSWEEVECAGACVNAPMVQVHKDVYEDLTPESFEKVLDALARGEKPKAGPQIGRRSSDPVSGLTSLTDPSLFDGSMIGQGAGLAAARAAIASRQAPAQAPAGDTPAKPPAAPAVKAEGEADREKVGGKPTSGKKGK